MECRHVAVVGIVPEVPERMLVVGPEACPGRSARAFASLDSFFASYYNLKG